MANQNDVIAARYEAEVAVLQRIVAAAAPGASAPRAVADLALAYRYLAGGAQPGSTVVEK